MITFNCENMVPQTFPFCKTIMDYIYKNVSADQLLKLYQTCKFFYNKFQLNIIEDFEICGSKNNERIVGNSLAIWQRNPLFFTLNNLWISRSFSFVDDDDSDKIEELDHDKYSRLTYTYLNISAHLFVKDYEFVVKPSTLRHFRILGSVFHKDSGLDLSIDDIIERAPHVSTFDLSFFISQEDLPPIDWTKFISSHRETKITSLHLNDLPNIPDPLLVIEFFKAHASPDIDYYFEIFNNDANSVKTFYKTIEDGLRAWKLSLAIPPTISSSFIDLTGKTAVITGAGEGIGRATVIFFRQLGATVIALGNNQFQLKNLIDECQDIKNNVSFGYLLLDPVIHDIKKIFQRINYKFDILVSITDTCTSISYSRVVPRLFTETFLREESGVLHGYCNIIQSAAPSLAIKKGCVINVLYPKSLITTNPQKTEYCANLKQQIKNVENDLKVAGARINCVNPGVPPRTLPRPDGMSDIAYKKLLQESKKSYEKEVANAIAFLASDDAKLIDGSTLNVNPMNIH